MSFQAYMDNIQTKTGKSPSELKHLQSKKDFLKKVNLSMA